MRGEINTVHIHISFQNLVFLNMIILSQDGQPLPLYESNHYVNHNIIENVQSNLYVPNIHFFMHASVHAAYIYYWLLFPIFCKSFWVSLMAQTINNLLAMWETQVRSLGQEDLLENGMAIPVFLPWDFHRQRSLAGYRLHRSTQSLHKESDMTQWLTLSLFSFCASHCDRDLSSLWKTLLRLIFWKFFSLYYFLKIFLVYGHKWPVTKNDK